MTTQQIVDPSQIEPELLKIWEKLAAQNTMRASLFNLIVFNRLSTRTDYVRSIVQKVVDKFPCRTLFISSDPDSPHPYLKTAISVVIPQLGESATACDQIDIGVSGSDIDRVPFVRLPHLLPDLPIYLLWTEDPSVNHPLFDPLSKLATRIIFDSESADNLLAFSQTLLELRRKTNIDIADLNWARTEGWRELIASTFSSEERLSQLKNLSFLHIHYNAKETESFCHLKIQAMYLLAWMSGRLNWPFVKADPNLHFQFKDHQAEIIAEQWDRLGSGTIISVEIQTKDGISFEANRIPEMYHHVKIQINSKEKCDLPYRFILGRTSTGQSLVTEICTKGTSEHYLEMLKTLAYLDQDKLC